MLNKKLEKKLSRYIKSSAITLIASISCCISLNIYSQVKKADIVDIYKIAQKNDVIIKQERELFNAAQQEKNIARGELLPQLNLFARRSLNKIDEITTPREFYSTEVQLTLDQVIFDWAKWNTYLRTKPLITAAEKNWYLANQDLILRVSEAYFNILRAIDEQDFFQKQYDATNELYNETKARFDVGQITIADIEQVKADLDSVNADLINAKNTVANTKEILQEIINIQVPNLAQLYSKPVLPELNPKTLEEWLDIARNHNLEMLVADANRLAAKKQISIAEAGYTPVVNFNATLRGSDNRQILQFVNGVTRRYIHSVSATIEATSPNLNPYGTIANTKQARALYHQADQEYIQAYRAAEKNVKLYYRDAISTKKEIYAREQAIKAAKVSLDATREGFEVGTRNYVVVLDRISELYSAMRDHNTAIYNHINAILQLENAAGRLNITDLIRVNTLLDSDKNPKKKSLTKPKFEKINPKKINSQQGQQPSATKQATPKIIQKTSSKMSINKSAEDNKNSSIQIPDPYAKTLELPEKKSVKSSIQKTNLEDKPHINIRN